MELGKVRDDLSVRAKNGVGFICAGIIIWSIITTIFLLPLELKQKNTFTLFTTGLMFPLAVGFSTFLKADWKLENNPLGKLGLYLNLAQIIYFPIIFWAIIKSPSDAILFFAIITGAHFFPYGWFYHAKPYYVMAPISAVFVMVLGFFLNGVNLWLIPFTFAILLLLLLILLHLDYKRKVKVE